MTTIRQLAVRKRHGKSTDRSSTYLCSLWAVELGFALSNAVVLAVAVNGSFDCDVAYMFQLSAAIACFRLFFSLNALRGCSSVVTMEQSCIAMGSSDKGWPSQARLLTSSVSPMAASTA